MREVLSMCVVVLISAVVGLSGCKPRDCVAGSFSDCAPKCEKGCGICCNAAADACRKSMTASNGAKQCSDGAGPDSISDYEFRGCLAGYLSSCSNLGYMYEHGQDGVARDYLNAQTYYLKACDLGSSSACEDAKRVVAEGKKNHWQ